MGEGFLHEMYFPYIHFIYVVLSINKQKLQRFKTEREIEFFIQGFRSSFLLFLS